jgi:hypothetical protein
LEKLNLLTQHTRRRHSDDFFFINAFRGSKYLTSLVETAALRVTARNISSVSPPATAVQLEVFLLQMQFVNLQIPFGNSRLHTTHFN